jgi:hypothetical protein
MCTHEKESIKSIYINKTFGLCISNNSLGGQPITIFTKVEKSNIDYISSNIVNYVVCMKRVVHL